MNKFFLELNSFDDSFVVDKDGEYIFTIDTRENKSLEKKFNIFMSRGGIESKIIFKIIASDGCFVDVNPVLKIEKGQSKTSAYISIKTLMIGSPKKIRIIPSLEISENDVKAGHGAVISGIDPEEMYYLNSKGLDMVTSRNLIINSFLTKN